MMIHIYDKKDRSFHRNGLGVLNQSQSCTILEKLNGIYELKLSYPLHDKKAEHLIPYNVIKADGQLFRIYHAEKESRAGLVHVSARHIFYDLVYKFIEDIRVSHKTCKEGLMLISEELRLDEHYVFDSDIDDVYTQYIIRKNGAEAIFMLTERWRGELLRDNYKIAIKKNRGKNKGVSIRYGKNIIGISEKINTENALTWIYPVGAHGLTLPEKYLLNPLWTSDEYPDFAMIKKIEFKDATSEGMLRLEAEKYLEAHSDFDVNYKIDFLQLEKTEQYKGYAPLLSVEVGDTVTVKHEILGISIEVKVIGIEKDLLRSQNSKVELGQPLSTLDEYLSEVERNSQEMASTLSQAMSSMLFFTNPSTLTIGNQEREVIYMPVSVLSSTNLMSYLILSVQASGIATLTVTYSLNNSVIPTNFRQKLQVGDNLIAIPMALVAIKEGGHYLSVRLSVDFGTLTIMPNALQLAVDGRNLSGGLSSEVPYALVREDVKYQNVAANKVGFLVDAVLPDLSEDAAFENILYTDMAEGNIEESINITFELEE